MRRLLFLAALALSGSTFAQNLIPNPGFESVGTAPCSWITTTSGFVAAINNWTMPSDGSTDIFSTYVATTCYGHNLSTNASRVGQQTPHGGNVQSALLTYGAGCGSLPNYREYLQATLTSPMISGQSYDIEFWLSMGDESQTATNNFGVHFRSGSYYSATCFVIPLTPQFNHTGIVNNKTGWVQISGTVTATANWTHAIFGNFFSNAATTTQAVGGSSANSRYYIDDVVVRPAIILPASGLELSLARAKDGSVDLNWTATDLHAPQGWAIQRSPDQANWETIANLETPTLAHKDRFAPRANTWYRLRYTDENGQSHSTEAIAAAPTSEAYRVYLAGNPVTKGSPAQLRIANADDTPAQLLIYDLQGKEMFASHPISLLEMEQMEIPTEFLKPAVYLVRVKTSETVYDNRLLVVE